MSGPGIVLPGAVGAIPDLPVDAGECPFATDVRATSTAVSTVVTQTASKGLPGGWQGAAHDEAGVVLTRFSRNGDAVLAALETVSTGLDVYLFQMSRLRARRERLDDDRVALNADVADLATRIRQQPEAPSALVTQWRDEAARLSQRHDAVVADVQTLTTDVGDAEQRLVRVLQSVDTDQEAQTAAHAPGRPDPAALLTALRRLPDAAAVARWWKGLTAAQREALMAADPGVVGTTDGVPVLARDDANRAALARDLVYLHDLQADGVTLSDAQARQLKNAVAAQDALDRGDALVDRATGESPGAFLVDYDPTAFGGDGAVAVSIGNPDTADHTAVVVPGLGNDASKIPGLTADAANVYQQARDYDSAHSDAVIAWMGYDAPSFDPTSLEDVLTEGHDESGVLDEAKAEAGGHELVGFVAGLRATHHGAPTTLTVIGHSYGSTTVAHAATDGMHADDVVLVGSPGAGNGVTNVAGLHTAPGHVFVGAAENDPVTWLGGDDPVGLGHDPSQASFGATRFSVDPGPTFHLGDVSTGFHTHSSYFDAHSTSLSNIGHVVDGQAPQVVPGRTESAHHHLTSWADGEARYQLHQHVVAPLEHAGQQVVHGAEDGLHDAEQGGKDLVHGAEDGLHDAEQGGKSLVHGAEGGLHHLTGGLL